MQQPVALRGRAKFSALFKRIIQTARQQVGWQEPDARNLRSLAEVVLAILVKRSTRLITLAQVVINSRRAQSVKAVAMSLAYFLSEAKLSMNTLSSHLLGAILKQVPSERMLSYRIWV